MTIKESIKKSHDRRDYLKSKKSLTKNELKEYYNLAYGGSYHSHMDKIIRDHKCAGKNAAYFADVLNKTIYKLGSRPIKVISP